MRGILRSPIYAGNLAGYKRIAANMKSKKRPSKLPEEWEVIPDTHEGIVTQEEFDTVQQLMTSRRREQNAGGFENIFSGVIKCADCGYAMRAASANRRKRPDIIDCVQYTCNNYGRYGNVMCTAHSIEARDLFNAVLADINRFADMAVNDEKAVRAIERRLTETDQSRAKIYYKFIGFVGELHITPTKRWTALKPKNCTVCGVEYVPSSGISKYCPACAKRIQREKSNESKRRSRERNRRACIELSAKNDRLILNSRKDVS